MMVLAESVGSFKQIDKKEEQQIRVAMKSNPRIQRKIRQQEMKVRVCVQEGPDLHDTFSAFICIAKYT